MNGTDERPLSGKRVVVTRARAQAADFIAWLETQGAEAIAFPTIRIVAPADPKPLAAAATRAGDYDWIVFTSVNGVEHFWAALSEAGLGTRALAGVRLAAIGPATADALAAHGVLADVVPQEYVAEAVVAAVTAAADVRGARILLPRAAEARDVLPDELRAAGGSVDDVEAYRTVAESGDAAAEMERRLRAGEIDVVTFTASSTVRGFVDSVGTEIAGAIVACIGPITAGTARELGLDVAVVAEEHTIPGLEAALLRHFRGEGAPRGERGGPI